MKVYNFQQKETYTFAAFLSLLFPGLGQLVKGNLAGVLLVYTLFLFTYAVLHKSFFLFIGMFIMYIAQIVHAARKQMNYNDLSSDINLFITFAILSVINNFMNSNYKDAFIGIFLIILIKIIFKFIEIMLHKIDNM